MATQHQSLSQTLHLIVAMLRFDDMAQEELIEQFRNKSVDWDAIVTIASQHLVLPAVYCRLEQKSQLSYLPEELVQYLKELTKLNRNRNQTLKEEAQAISQLFRKHHIDHVFIKGIALLLGNYYRDLGERMIGDIDILIASNDLDKAFELLVAEGYSQFVSFNYEVKNYRHRPRQISKNRLGAIELHEQLLKNGYNHLLDKKSFMESQEVVNDVSIPSSRFIIWNTILAHQINNQHSYLGTIHLKGMYDVLVLNLDQKPNLIIELSKEKHCLRFLSLLSVFVPSIAPTPKNNKLSRYRRFFLLTLRFPNLGRVLFKMKWVNMNIQERLHLLFFNKSYRAHVVKNKLFR